MTSGSFYWPSRRTPKPKPKPPPASPEMLAWARSVRANVWNCDASDYGLLPCPRCGATRGVRLDYDRRPQFRSRRHMYAHCHCGCRAVTRYTATHAVRAWNDPAWRSIVQPCRPEDVPPIPEPSTPLLPRPRPRPRP